MTSVILLAVALAGLLLAQFTYYAVLYRGERRQAELRRRLRAVVAPDRAPQVSVLKERRLAGSRALERLLDSFAWARKLEAILLETDLRWHVTTLLAATLAAPLATGLALGLLLGRPLLAVAAALAVAPLPLAWVLSARARRSMKLSSQLPDAIDTMVRSLRAGHGLSAALRLVAEEMPLPVALEFGRCFEEQRLGVSEKDAMRNLAQRASSNLDLRIFAVSVIIHHDTGGNLVEILEKIATTVRERFKFYGKLRALTIEAKLSGIILGVLPFVVLGVVALLRPAYLEPLVSDPIGRLIALAGLLLWLTGVVSMRRLSRVDY